MIFILFQRGVFGDERPQGQKSGPFLRFSELGTFLVQKF